MIHLLRLLAAILTVLLPAGVCCQQSPTTQPEAAAEQFQKTVDHPFVDPMWVNTALAHLGLARARALQGDRAGARQEYETVLTIWKDADPDLPVLLAAKGEVERLGKP